MRPQLYVSAMLLLVVAVAAAPAFPIGCTVIMYSSYDYTLQGDGRSKCIATVESARQTCGGTRLNFIPTLYFGFTNKKLDRYCTDFGDSCAQIDTNRIANFRRGMVACFKRAVALGFTTLETTPHLDDASGQQWRNAIPFNPQQRYAGFSYVDIMVAPLAAAFHTVLSAKVKVYLSMQGEMGATLIRHPRAWIPIIKSSKGLVLKRSKKALARNVKVGVSWNWNKMCGCFSESGAIDPEAYLRTFIARFTYFTKVLKFDLPAIRALFNTVDFIGASYYPYKAQALNSAALEHTGTLFARELALYGVDLGKLIKAGKSFRLHEYGFGGGKGGGGSGTPERDVKKLMRFTFFGVGGPYSKASDPFKTYHPEQDHVPQRDLLRKFWVRSMRWFANRGGPRYKFDAVYIWNSGSWDITGTNPDSRSAEGSWGDAVTRKRIKAFNNRGAVP